MIIGRVVNHKVEFQDLLFDVNQHGDGTIAKITFANGYGASVIRFPHSLGWPDLYELAVVHEGKVDSTTPITDNVLGHLTPNEVTNALREIADLPSTPQLSGEEL